MIDMFSICGHMYLLGGVWLAGLRNQNLYSVHLNGFGGLVRRGWRDGVQVSVVLGFTSSLWLVPVLVPAVRSP